MSESTDRSARVMRLRYAGSCTPCAAPLAVGTRAQYDPATKTLTCLGCIERAAALAGSPPEPGVAGASAAAEFRRRHDRHEQRVRDRHPILGGFILFMNDDPQHVRAWQTGAGGEIIMGRKLGGLSGKGVVALHDRRIPGSRANIDHIAIGPSGIYVIDAKKYTGRIDVASRSWFGESRLWVGKRDCSKLADAMPRQVAAVSAALGDLPEARDVPVTPVLCFVAGDWPLFFAPDSFHGVRLEGEGSTCRLVSRPGPLTRDQIHLIAHRLHAKLPPAHR